MGKESFIHTSCHFVSLTTASTCDGDGSSTSSISICSRPSQHIPSCIPYFAHGILSPILLSVPSQTSSALTLQKPSWCREPWIRESGLHSRPGTGILLLTISKYSLLVENSLLPLLLLDPRYIAFWSVNPTSMTSPIARSYLEKTFGITSSILVLLVRRHCFNFTAFLPSLSLFRIFSLFIFSLIIIINPSYDALGCRSIMRIAEAILDISTKEQYLLSPKRSHNIYCSLSLPLLLFPFLSQFHHRYS